MRTILLFIFISVMSLVWSSPSRATSTDLPLQTVAVWDFEDQTVAGLTLLKQLDFLKRTLSEAVLGALVDEPSLKVVDRQQLRNILTEQKLGSSDLADTDTRLRLGHMIGAQRMVFGSFMAIGDQIRVNLRTVDSATSQVLYADEYTIGYEQVFAEAQKMAERLAKALGGRPLHTSKAQTNILWEEYDHALELSDAGHYSEALEVLKSVLTKVKNFAPAERQLSFVLEKLSRQ